MRNFDPEFIFYYGQYRIYGRGVFVPGRAGIDRRSNDAAAS